MKAFVAAILFVMLTGCQIDTNGYNYRSTGPKAKACTTQKSPDRIDFHDCK